MATQRVVLIARLLFLSFYDHYALTGFFPPPTKLKVTTQKNALLIELNLTNMTHRKKPFVNLCTRALFPTSAETPFDAFCPSMQAALPQCICDVCKLAFPSRAQMLSHRRGEHKYKRYQGVDIKEILAIEHDERLNSISQIIDAEVGAKEYKAIFTNGSVNWITITSDSHPKVKEYHIKTSQNLQVHSLAQALWMNPVWKNV